MRFCGRVRQSESYVILIRPQSLGLSKLLNYSQIIHFLHNVVNLEAQNVIIGFELEIIE